jgi:hypothetical protein
MAETACEHCGGPLRLDQRLQRHLCRRCGRIAPAAPVEPANLVSGSEVIDWLGERAITRYFMARDDTPAREPNPVYLAALRRSYQQGTCR